MTPPYKTTIIQTTICSNEKKRERFIIAPDGVYLDFFRKIRLRSSRMLMATRNTATMARVV